MISWMAASTAFALPDLRVEMVIEPNGQVAVVKNVGDQASRGFYTDIWYHAPVAPLMGEFGDFYAWHPGLGPGQTAYIDIVPYNTWYPQIWLNWDGGWIDVFVDTDGLVAEGNEGNNLVSFFCPTTTTEGFTKYGADGFLDQTRCGSELPVNF